MIIYSSLGLLSALTSFNLLNFPSIVSLHFFNIIFGFIIVGSTFNMQIIAKNFFFILTGHGKGAFNLFIGFLIFSTDF